MELAVPTGVPLVRVRVNGNAGCSLPRGEPARRLGGVRMRSSIPGGDIFNDFPTEPWAALRTTETSSSC